MIKLNNKNITYVALADSNNSLKAPKEIWYADSSNSVKLVYRRKDALIEGVDYEKYHWLNGRNGAYINTEHLVKTYEDAFEVYAKYDGTNRNSYGILKNPFGIEGENIRIASYIDGENCINAVIKQNESYSNYNIFIHKDVFKIALYAPNSSEYVKSLDGISYTNPIGGTVTNNTNLKMYVFARNGKVNSYFDGDISYFKITDPTFVTDKLHLIPCKLLKPVPKWLDANGIRRQVGECGMIDLVSGKFYGNVNSVGTFTVENYYERKEWLIGDGTAYINTKVTSYTGIISIKYNFIESEIINNESAILGRERADYTITDFSSRLVFLLKKSTGNLELHGSDVNVTKIQYLTTDTIDVDVVNNTFTTSTQSGSVNIGDNVVGRNLYLFASNSGSSAFRLFNGKIAYLRISNKLNLIPCTLTMDLPASMDANNIARTKGTSGMWDLVSDRFYGNVANSGTFKAVNLAEGVDYEIHDWLVANIPIGVMTMRLFVNQSSSVNYTVNITTTSNSIPLFRTAINGNKEDYVYFNNVSKLNVWSYINGTSASVNTIYSNNGLYNIELSPSEFIINSISATKYGDAYTIVWYNNPMNNTVGVTSTSKITVDGVERYIPVKLLRSIPSKYDANGIARQAGECGMYDTVNDVFYGNVASSGSFTVSDDN